jgi:hypothetical protein
MLIILLMENTNIERIINNSFLARVPALVESGLTIDEAIQQAYNDDLAFNCELQNGSTERSKKARQILCNRSYTTLRVREEIRGFETRAEAIALQA